MPEKYEHLGSFSDWVAYARTQQQIFPVAKPGPETQQKVLEVLGFTQQPETPQDVRIERTWEADGISGEVISWSVGYGSRTEAFLMKPTGMKKPLPAVLALHDHGGFKWFGKEKIANGPDGIADPILTEYQQDCYGSRAWVNALVHEGFVVLAHDTFLWGSRRFPWEVVSGQTSLAHPNMDFTIQDYNAAAGGHEHIVEKYCNLLGTTLAGIVSHEDRIALNYLLSREEVNTEKVACMGLSGGGNRSALLMASHDGLAAAAIIALMSTYEGLLDHNVASHTWMLYPSGWSKYGEWPDLAACRAPKPLLVQYDKDDALFSLAGMQAADERLRMHYESIGQPEAYTGQFYDGPHKFDLKMQEAAFLWLKEQLTK